MFVANSKNLEDMKQIILISTFLILLGGKMFAQDVETKLSPEERARFQTEWMKQNLSLSDDQLVQIEPLNLKYAQKMEEVKAISGKIGKLKKAKAIMDEKDGQLKKILNKDQFDVYLEKREEIRDKMKEAAQQRKNSWNRYSCKKVHSLII